MAIVKINTKKRMWVKFQERELARFSGIDARVTVWQKKSYIDFAIPFMTWQGHDVRVVRDLIDALKKVGNYSAKIKGARAGWNAHAQEPTILRADKIRVAVYENHSDPHVQVERGKDGFVKWTVLGHYCNDDLPSVVAYVAALQKLVTLVKDERF